MSSTPNDIRYLSDGRACRLIARDGDRYIVAPLYDHDGETEGWLGGEAPEPEDYPEGPPERASSVYHRPPP